MDNKHSLALQKAKEFALSYSPKPICIVLHGSLARKHFDRFSDIDLTVILPGDDSKKTSRIPKIVNGVVVNIAFVNIRQFVSIFGTKDVYEVIWKKAVTPESIAIYDPYKLWPKIKKSCYINIDKELEEAIVFRNYNGALTYLCKINNAYANKNEPYLYDASSAFSQEIARIILTINKRYLNSWKNIYGLLKTAKNKPTNFWKHYSITAGYKRKGVTSDLIVKNAFQLLKKTQEILKRRYNKNIKNKYFKDFLYEDLSQFKIIN